MSTSNDSALKTLIVATLLCVVCSVLVSTAAVMFKPLHDHNKQQDIQKNILLAAGLLSNDDQATSPAAIARAFAQVETQLVDLATGEVIASTASSDPEQIQRIENYDSQKAAKDPEHAHVIPPQKDLGKIRTRGKWGKVYLTKNARGETTYTLPISGKGLWSTLYGFLTLEQDARTVAGIGFYQHGETPGLGGEVDNPKWKTSWRGKRIMNQDLQPIVQVLKGSVELQSPEAYRQIDGLSGATITSRGVEHLVKYWLGPDGYGSYLAKQHEKGNEQEQEDDQEHEHEDHTEESP